MNVWISVIVIKQWQFWGVKSCYHSASGMFSIRHAHLSLWQKWPRSHFFSSVERSLLLSVISGVFYLGGICFMTHVYSSVRRFSWWVDLLIWYMMNENHYFIYMIQFSRSVISYSLQPHGLQHARLISSRSLLKLMPIEAVMASNRLILCNPFLLPLSISQHQGLFRWVSSSHQVAEVLEFQLQHQSFQWIFRTDFL